jgi:hypothetical protein
MFEKFVNQKKIIIATTATLIWKNIVKTCIKNEFNLKTAKKS